MIRVAFDDLAMIDKRSNWLDYNKSLIDGITKSDLSDLDISIHYKEDKVILDIESEDVVGIALLYKGLAHDMMSKDYIKFLTRYFETISMTNGKDNTAQIRITSRYIQSNLALHYYLTAVNSPWRHKVDIKRLNNHIVVECRNESIELYEVKNRYICILLYLIGFIDCTSKTNAPIWLWNRHSNRLISRDSNIHVFLVANNPRSKLCSDKTIRDIIAKVTAQMTITDCVHPVINPFRTLNGKGFKNLEIGYDDYYPNKRLVLNLARRLGKYRINLIPHRNDYYSPSQGNDLNLLLIYTKFEHEFFLYHQIALLLFKQDSNRRRRANQLVDSCLRGLITADECRDLLWRTISETRLAFDLGSLKSCFLYRDKLLTSEMGRNLFDTISQR